MENKEYFINGKYVVKCIICGHYAGSLYIHLQRNHNLTTKEYRQQFGENLLVKRHSAQKGLTKETSDMVKNQSIKLIGHKVSIETRNKIRSTINKFNTTSEGIKKAKTHSKFMIDAHKSGKIKTPEAWKIAGRKAANIALKTFLLNETKHDRLLRLKNWIRAGALAGGKSHIEKKLLEELQKYNIGIIHYQYNILNYNVDIYIENLNLVLELYGDYWHCNPKKYDSDFNRRGKLAKDIWLHDEKRKQNIQNAGFYFEIIWESDYSIDYIDSILIKYKH